jgi:hypothetical protein
VLVDRDVEMPPLRDARRVRVRSTYGGYLYGLLPEVGTFTPFLGSEATFSAWPE